MKKLKIKLFGKPHQGFSFLSTGSLEKDMKKYDELKARKETTLILGGRGSGKGRYLKKPSFFNVWRNDCQMKDVALWADERFAKDMKTEIKTLPHKIRQSKAGFELGTPSGGCMLRCFSEDEFRLDLVPDYVTVIHQLVDPETGKRFYRYVDTYGAPQNEE